VCAVRSRVRRESVELIVEFRAPREAVFERLTCHEDMRHWPGVSDCRLIRPGTPRNGLGAIRAVHHTRWFHVEEEVVHYDPPRRFDYVLVRGLAVDHRASVRLEERDGVTTVSYEVALASRIPFVALALGFVLRHALRRAFSMHLVPAVEGACS
jgi:uncharacterized protein YndB with AHSA1/START domain